MKEASNETKELNNSEDEAATEAVAVEVSSEPPRGLGLSFYPFCLTCGRRAFEKQML